ncbi:MAG: hypothetical protein ABIZ49_02545 [Opitutaceae bacterium]
METVTIRELRQNWPAVEKRLAASGELSVTRDGVAVAQLTAPRPVVAKKTKKRFDAEEHRKLLEKIWGKKPRNFQTDDWLARERADRNFASPKP